MAQISICDECKRVIDPKGAAVSVTVALTTRNGFGDVRDIEEVDRDFCSRACLVSGISSYLSAQTVSTKGLDNTPSGGERVTPIKKGGD